MAAFSPYSGAYKSEGREFNWRCYATTPVHDMRLVEHGGLDAAPGRRWVEPQRRHAREPQVACLVDSEAGEFSQILTQVSCQSDARDQAA